MREKSKLPAILALLWLGCGDSMSDEKGPLNLHGDQYWEDPLSHTGNIGFDRLSDEVEGIVVDLPEKVFLEKRSTIPIVCLRTQSKAKAQKVSLAMTAQLVASHLETGAIQVVKLGRSPDVRDKTPPSKGWINEWLEADLRSLVDLGPALGRYDVWVVCGNEASNQRSVVLYPQNAKADSKEFRESIRSLRWGTHSLESGDARNTEDNRNKSGIDKKPREEYFILSLEDQSPTVLALRLRFKIEGIPRFLEQRLGADSAKPRNAPFARLPVQLLGFDKDHRICYSSLKMVPVASEPSGNAEHPVFSGDFLFQFEKQEAERAKRELATMWAISLSHRSFAGIRP